MKLYLKNDVQMGLHKDRSIQHLPRLVADDHTVYLTPIVDDAKLEKAKVEMIGKSPWLWESGDSFLFDKASKELSYLSLVIPEKNKKAIDIKKFFQYSGSQGLPTLDVDISFEIPSMRYRFYSKDYNILFCFNDDLLDSDSFEEIVISGELSLLFTIKGYSGWKLKSPEKYIVDNLSSRVAGESTSFIKDCFSNVLDTIEESNIDRMDDITDLEPLEDMYNLYRKIVNSPERDSQILKVLAQWLYDVADRFYPEDKMRSIWGR